MQHTIYMQHTMQPTIICNTPLYATHHATHHIYAARHAARPSFRYDIWFDYIRLEEEHGDLDRTRDVSTLLYPRAPSHMAMSYWAVPHLSPSPTALRATHEHSGAPPLGVLGRDCAVPDSSESRHACSPSACSQVYERAIANVPPSMEKRAWKRCVVRALTHRRAYARTCVCTHARTHAHTCMRAVGRCRRVPVGR